MLRNAANANAQGMWSTKLLLSWGLSLLLLGGTAGCSKRYHNLPAFSAIPMSDAANQSVGRFKTSYLADQIHAYFRGNASAPIAVTTFVDIDNLYQSSTFGRVLAEQLMSELTMRGYNVIEMRLSDAMQIMFHTGELGLSREIGTLRPHHEIAGLVVGTYTASPVRVYLNARMIDPSTSMVLSAGTVEMAKTQEIARLLRTSSFPTTLERIPVRHLGYGFYPAPHYWPGYGFAVPVPQWNQQEWEVEEEEPRMAPQPKLPDQGARKASRG